MEETETKKKSMNPNSFACLTASCPGRTEARSWCAGRVRHWPTSRISSTTEIDGWLSILIGRQETVVALGIAIRDLDPP